MIGFLAEIKYPGHRLEVPFDAVDRKDALEQTLAFIRPRKWMKGAAITGLEPITPGMGVPFMKELRALKNQLGGD